jgi:hypothetical protein
MSTKKLGFVAGIAIALSVVVSPAFAACSLTTMSECDNAGLMTLIAQMLSGSQTQTQTTTGAAISGIPAGFTFTTNLKQGSTGNDVKYLQVLLNSDAATSIGNSGKETTYFGTATKAAVVKFQNKYASEVLTPYGLKAGTGFFGSASRVKANAMIASGTTTTTTTGGTTTTTTTTPATGAYTVALAANQPAGTIASGSAYNTMLKINVSAGSTAQTITSVTVQRTGLSVDNKVAGVLVVDETGARHGNIVTLASGVATINFTAEPITVAAGTTKTIEIQYNIDATNGKAGTVGASVTAMTGTPAGLPLVGNTFSMADGSTTLGSLSIDAVQLSAADVTKDVGSTGYDIAKFKFTAGSVEDVLIKKVTVYQNGNSSDTDVANIKLVAPDGTVLATVASSTNKYVTFDLTASPYKITKGNVKDLVVRIDVANGSSRTIQYVIQNDYDVVVTGSSTGVSVLPVVTEGVDHSFPMGDVAHFNTVSINAGSLVIQKAATTPSGTIAIGGNSITLATWKFQARGEDIEVRRLQAYITGAGIADNNGSPVALSGTVRLVTEDGTILATVDPATTSLVKVTTNVTGASITLSSYYTIPAGTSKNISLVVDTASTLATTATLNASISTVYYKQLSTNAFSTANDGAGSKIAGNTMSASGANLTAVKNSSVGNSKKVAGQSNVKIGSYLLQTSSTEGVNVSSIAVNLRAGTAANLTGDLTASLTNLTLKKTDGTILGSSIGTPTVGSAAWGTANSFSVSGSLNIPANTTVQVDVYTDIPTALEGYLASEIVTSGISATGASSGITVTLAPSSDQVAQIIQVVAGGTLTVAEETSGTASSQFLSTGLSGVEMGKIKFAATVEDMKIDRLEIRTINGNGNLAQIKLLGTGLTTDPIAPTTNGVAVFTFQSGSELTIPAYGSRVLTIAADTTNVGTLIPGSLVAVGFGTANAKGAGSGNIVEELVGTAVTTSASTVAGDILYITESTLTGSLGAGYYMITTDNNGVFTAAGNSLNGTAVTIASTTNISKLSDTVLTTASATVAKGDVVYIYDASASVAGFYIVINPIAAATLVSAAGDVVSVAIEADSIVTKITNVNALVSNTMQFEEVKPTISKNASSPSGTTSASSDQIIALFDVKAEGSRDLSFSRLTVEKGGNVQADKNVYHFSLYNGTTKLAEVNDTTITGTAEAVTASTFTWLNLGIDSAAEKASLNVGDTIRIVNNSITSTRVVASITGAAAGSVSGADSGSTGITITGGNVALAASAIIIYNNRVHFDGYSDVVLAAQTITAGQTMTLTVRADTTSVKNDGASGQTVTFTASVPGQAGPLVTTVGGLNWSYTTLYNGAVRSTNKADAYPVAANTLSY